MPIRKYLACAMLVASMSGFCWADAVTQWNQTALESIMRARYVATSASRCLAMVHVAVYDAVNSIDGSHSPYLGTVDAPAGSSAEAAAATAAYEVLSALFPAQASILDTTLADYLVQIPDGAPKTQGIGVGVAAADAVVMSRMNDGSMAMIPYTPGTDPGDWRPTPPMNAPAMMPHWANVTPFAMTRNSQFRSAPPPPLRSMKYSRALNEVKDIGAKNSATRTQQQTMTAMFWADMPGTETTVGRWNLVARSVAGGNTLAQNARLFALLNIAMADAGIVAWNCKYTYNFWRPITAIREADTDGNRNTAPDAGWEPLLMTPAFPEYNSAHSTFSAAAAAMLSKFFGSDAATFEIKAYSGGMETRIYTSFSEAAREAGMSRIYGGIHYSFSDSTAQAAGRRVCQWVWSRLLR